MKRKIILSVIVLLTFLASRNIKYFFVNIVFGKEAWGNLDTISCTNILVSTKIVIILLVTLLFFGKNLFQALHMNTGFTKGLTIGFLSALPMFIGYGVLSNFSIDIDLNTIYRNVVLAGFYEEFLFRGFLFGILFYYAGWGFIPALIIPSIYFGLGHLYQAETVNDSINIFLFTSLASAGFAWFYTAWNNLWVVIFLHAFMDLAWDMFNINTDVTGNLMVNVFRFATLGTIIFLSVRNLKYHPEWQINDKLWINKSAFIS